MPYLATTHSFSSISYSFDFIYFINSSYSNIISYNGSLYLALLFIISPVSASTTTSSIIYYPSTSFTLNSILLFYSNSGSNSGSYSITPASIAFLLCSYNYTYL